MSDQSDPGGKPAAKRTASPAGTAGKPTISFSPGEGSAEDLQRALYGPHVEFVYASNFNASVNETECVIGFGTARPPGLLEGNVNVLYSHRVHLPLRTAMSLANALTQLFQVIAQQQAQRAQQSAAPDARH